LTNEKNISRITILDLYEGYNMSKSLKVHWHQATWAQRIERWENVLRVLQNLTPHERKKRWDMGDYGHVNECGTVACAAGHCGLDPWFRRRGFKMDFFVIHEYKRSLIEVHGFSVKEAIIESTESDFPEMNAPEFFGETGFDYIFNNGAQRSVCTVIKEVKNHIKILKEEQTETI
jgi:hypothetical protein